TPPGARPNRDPMTLPASGPGRLLERSGDAAPRGMTVQDRTRLIGRLRPNKAKSARSPVSHRSGRAPQGPSRMAPTPRPPLAGGGWVGGDAAPKHPEPAPNRDVRNPGGPARWRQPLRDGSAGKATRPRPLRQTISRV